jgi:CRP-like cAMP-binding protein
MYVTPADWQPSQRQRLYQNLPVISGNAPKDRSYLYYEGDNVDWLYQVTSGVVRLTRLPNGRRQVISFGGDIGFPSAGDHHTDCDALVDTLTAIPTDASAAPATRRCIALLQAAPRN